MKCAYVCLLHYMKWGCVRLSYVMGFSLHVSKWHSNNHSRRHYLYDSVCLCVCVIHCFMIQRSQAKTDSWLRYWYTGTGRTISCPVWRTQDIWQAGVHMCFTNNRRALYSGVLLLPHSEDRQQWWLWLRPRRSSAWWRHLSAALAVSHHKTGFPFRSLCACHQTQLFAPHRSLLSDGHVLPQYRSCSLRYRNVQCDW